MRHGKIKGLDGLRGLAVLMVVFSHGQVYQLLGIDGPPAFWRLVNPLQGVKIFFVLSGFLITYLLIREQDKFGKVNIPQFYARRVLRLLPLYLLAIIIVLIMDYLGSAPVPNCAYKYLFTHTYNFAPQECQYMSTGHLWSLSVEEHFYLVWPFLFFLSRKGALAFATVFVVAGLAYSPMMEATGRSVWTFPVALSIAAGCIAAYAVSNAQLVRLFANRMVSWLALLMGVAGVFSPWIQYRESVFVGGVCLLVLYVYFNQDAVVTKLLDIKPLALTGVMSYGLYVWHGLLTGNGPYREAIHKFPPEIYTGLVLALVITPMSYYGFEKPFLQMKERFRQRAGSAAGVAQQEKR